MSIAPCYTKQDTGVITEIITDVSAKGKTVQSCSADLVDHFGGRPRPNRRYATLRWKTLLIVAATLMGLLVIVYIPLRICLLGSFVSLEQQLLLTDLAGSE
jgi:hypothetical protein